MKIIQPLVFLCYLIAICSSATLKPLLSNVFGDNMVLQRNVDFNLWGWSVINDDITVSFGAVKYTTRVTDVNGKWTMPIFSAAVSSVPIEIVVVSLLSGNTVTASNVLIGDVFFCGGQSNMQFTVNSVFNATQALADAVNHPNIRIFTVGQSTTSDTPLEYLATIEQPWSVPSATTLGDGAAAFSYFSAVCWFYGVEIQKRYPNVPIGLISSNWGGTQIQQWSSANVTTKCPQPPSPPSVDPNPLATEPREYTQQQTDIKKKVGDGSGSLYNAMIVPFFGVRITAFLWYQAEANVGQTELYKCYFPAMIEDWRDSWGQGDLPFFFVQLAPYTTDGPLPYPYSLPDMRLAQTTGLMLPNVAMASAIDLGDIGSPFTNIHPRNKQTVAARLALLADEYVYQTSPAIWQGPTYVASNIIRDYPNPEILVNFIHIGDGLYGQDGSCPFNTSECAWMELGLSDGTWVNVTASVTSDEESVIVFGSFDVKEDADTPHITALRYLYANWPVPTIFNSAGLPASPFYNVYY